MFTFVVRLCCCLCCFAVFVGCVRGGPEIGRINLILCSFLSFIKSDLLWFLLSLLWWSVVFTCCISVCMLFFLLHSSQVFLSLTQSCCIGSVRYTLNSVRLPAEVNTVLCSCNFDSKVARHFCFDLCLTTDRRKCRERQFYPLLKMGVELGVLHWRKTRGWGCSKTGCRGRYLGLRGRDWCELHPEEVRDLMLNYAR